MNRTTYVFDGSITAVSPLAVSRPGDNFRFSGQSDKIQRLPRAGAKHPDTPVFFPASSLNGAIRRAAFQMIRRKLIQVTGEDNPVSLDAFYMMVQGVDTTQELESESGASGLVEEEANLRLANPFISLFGRWGLPGHWGIGDAIPVQDGVNPVQFITGNGARVNEWSRNSDEINFLNVEDKSRLKDILLNDSAAQKDIIGIKDEVKEKKKLKSQAKEPEEKQRIQDIIDQLEYEIKQAKSAKAGASESIQRPIDGYECIAPGTTMSHKMTAANVTDIELGLMIYSLAEFSRDPRLGSHGRQGAGEISAEWEIKCRPEGSWRSITVGKILLSFDEFQVHDATDEKVLSRAVTAFDTAVNDMAGSGIDFLRFKKAINS